MKFSWFRKEKEELEGQNRTLRILLGKLLNLKTYGGLLLSGQYLEKCADEYLVMKDELHEAHESIARLRTMHDKVYQENKKLKEGNPMLDVLLEEGINKTAEMVNKELVEENEKLKLKIESKPMRHARNQRKVIVRLQEEIIKLKESIKYDDLAFAEHKKCAEELVLEREAKEQLVKDNDENEKLKEEKALLQDIINVSRIDIQGIVKLIGEYEPYEIPENTFARIELIKKFIESKHVYILELKSCCTEQESTIERMQKEYDDIKKLADSNFYKDGKDKIILENIVLRKNSKQDKKTITDYANYYAKYLKLISFLKSKKLTNAFRVWEKKKKLTK